MSKINIFLTLTGYQITWLACVFGESKLQSPFFGIYVGIIFFALYFYFNNNKIKFLKITGSIAIPGYFFDTILVYFKIYEFNSSLIFLTLPLWMIVLWLSFSILFDKVLNFLKNYKILGLFLSCTLGPITYYFGKPIGLITINNLSLFFLLMIFFWFFLMFFYLKVLIEKY